MAIYSEFSHKQIVIFHSYVSLPEGIVAASIPWNFPSKAMAKSLWGLLEVPGIRDL